MTGETQEDVSNGERWLRRQAMLHRRHEVLEANPHITASRDVAPLMGDLVQEYWNWQLERLLEKRKSTLGISSSNEGSRDTKRPGEGE